MKKTVLMLVSISLFMANANAQKPNEDEDKTLVIKFTETLHDYGDIELNSDGLCEFKFTNKSKIPLILSNVRSSCGCTVPDWPRTPLEEGKEAVIKVKYNTARIGSFSKSITVYSNGSEQPIILRIKGNVVSKKS